MLYSLIHPGSGLGNQLHRIVAGKVLALDKGYEYSAIGRENFKGKDFMNLDFGPEAEVIYTVEEMSGKIVQDERQHNLLKRNLWEEKTNYYNPEFNFIEDGTIIDGEFQDERYFGHRLNEISEWLSPKTHYSDNADKCAIGFRGGEFYLFPELGLPREYFEEGIKRMKEINPNMKFEVHTDDEVLAKQFFPEYEVIHNVEKNWSTMRGFKYAIIANSSFYILPRLLKHNDKTLYKKDDKEAKMPVVTIAPRYWARRNTKEWSMPQNYYKCFTYL